MKPPGVDPSTALLVAVAAFLAIYAGVQALRIALLSRIVTHDLHAIVVMRASTSLVLIWTMFVAVNGILRLRGQNSRTVAWTKPSPMRGWLVAAGVTVDGFG